MKNLFLILLALGGLISTVDAQTFQKYQKPTFTCNTNATVEYPLNIPEGWDFNVLVKTASSAKIDHIKLYIDNKYMGKKLTPSYQWQLNTADLHLAPGQHKIRVIVVSKCGNTRQILKYFRVDKFR